jgi:hypothetical protein
MSDLTPWAPQPTPTVADFQSRAVARLGEWAHSAEAAYRVAETLVQSAFVPAQFRGKPMDATAAILAGSEVGLSPMASLRAFDVISGQAAPRALTLRAIAQSLGHDIEVTESTATRCKVRARRRGGAWQEVTWTMDRARDLGLAGKDPWRRQPQAMLVARATSEAARLVAADAILGIGYSAEEVADDGATEAAPAAQPTAESAPGVRRMGRARKAPEPPPEPEEPPLDEPAPAEEPLFPDQPEHITNQQLTKLHVVLKKAGLTDREAGLKVISDVVGRVVDSTKSLSKDEASRAIDHLEDVDDGWGEGVVRPDGGER